MTTTHPIVDTSAARALGEALRRVDYSEDGVCRLLGEDAYSIDADDAGVRDRRLPDSRLGIVVRTFFLQLPVPAEALAHAIGRRGVEALEATALAEVGDDEILSRVRILPVGDLLVASDGDTSYQGDDPPDYVSAYTPTSKLCDSLSPRPRVERALDVGTGSGVQALLAARHAREVVATDVNPRALAYTELNAALNGFTNIDCRAGSMFEPVEGETFDLITCNAPFVVSPENKWAYRDSGLPADEVSERIVAAAAEHLAEGGYATLLVSWIARDANDPEERPLAWVADTGCDAWILPIFGLDPLGHAARWNNHLAGADDDAFHAALDDWTDYLEGLGVEMVSEGAVLLHKRPGTGHSARVDAIDDDALDHAGDQIQRAFAARARLSELGKAGELLDARLAIGAPIRLERELEPGGGRPGVSVAEVEMSEGTNPTVEASTHVLDVVAALDGGTKLSDVVAGVAEKLGLSEKQAAELRQESLELMRELLELGALVFH
ncbi:MAG TPA: methyltransferase [Gaiellaceae bacterium]|nr:methyltransferase [Gaiellaceae bacterium]